MTNNYLLLFSLSPVQSFIAQARKTQDLFGGSKLLSDLVREATIEVGEGNVLFPNPKNASLPNRFIAKLEGKTPEEVKNLGERIENRIKNSWIKMADKVLNERSVPKPFGFDDQIENFWEVYWAALPYTDETYAGTFDKLNALLGAIKTTRPAEQYDYQMVEHKPITGEKGRKCSIDGERNVKFYRISETQFRKNKKKEDIRKDSLFAIENEIFPYNPDGLPLKYLQPGEGISAISFIKRCWNDESKVANTFESTADVALLRAKNFLLKNHFDEFLEYSKPFRSVQSIFNAQALYEENLTEKYFKKQGYQKLLPISNDIINKRKELESLAKKDEHDVHKFTKYYAVVVFDGDEMGKWMSGHYLNDVGQLPGFHHALSSKLSEFANVATDILEKGTERGCTVYAGGDDFLGLVNLNYLFPVLADLRTSFYAKVNKPLQDEFGFAKDLTFSAGIAIAHYKTPLNIVLDRARKMEDKAKEVSGKDAFSIAVMKHSGESHEINFNWKPNRTFKFEENDDKSYLTNAGYLQFLCEQLRDNFSRKFLKNIDKEFHQFHASFLDNNKEMFNVELKRLLKRSCLPKDKLKQPKKAEVKDRQIEKTAEALSMLYTGKEGFLQTLHLLDFVHRNLDSNA